ncbi:MAG: YkgJ family cysteine cluster protein [Lachnospiraceae bacterium]|nr:YkgJ family cysteine cluster protein [Lachnospiraceae bacterium]
MGQLTILDLISDGNLYKSDDVVLTDTFDCSGCSFCCEDMCDSIIIDPYDLYALEKGLHKDFNALIDEGYLELGLHNLLMLPHIKNNGNGCSFLTEEKRCGIHDIRPGICRLFPLGRYYHDETFSYILQNRGCKLENKGSIKVRDWLNIPELEKYEAFENRWHYFIKGLSNLIMENKDHDEKEQIIDSVLNTFYRSDYDTVSDFYDQIYSRMQHSHLL